MPFMRVEVTKDGIFLIFRDPLVIHKYPLSGKEAWELSRKLEQALFKWKELTGINPLKDIGKVKKAEVE